MFETTLAGSCPSRHGRHAKRLVAPWDAHGRALQEPRKTHGAFHPPAGRGRHRHRERRRAGAATFRARLLAEVDGVDFNKKVRMASAKPLRADADGDGAAQAPQVRARARGRVARATTRQAQVHLARPDDPDRHAGRRLLLATREDAFAFAELLNRRRGCREGGRRTSSSSTSRLQRLISAKRSNGVSGMEKAAEGPEMHHAVHICYGTASRQTSSGRRRWAKSGVKYEQTFPALDRSKIASVAGMPQQPRARRADEALKNKSCWSVRSMWPRTGSTH